MNKKKLILIAEDDVSIRTVLSTELENKYELKLTDNCAQLWNWVSGGLGDLIILDVVMPDENGLDLIPKIKEIRSDIKIIVISAQNTILTAMQAVEKGAYEYLAKPFDITELNKIIDVAFTDNDKSSNTYNKLKEKKIENNDQTVLGLFNGSKEVVLYCAYGERSALAIKKLPANLKAFHILKGIKGWIENKGSIEAVN